MVTLVTRSFGRCHSIRSRRRKMVARSCAQLTDHRTLLIPLAAADRAKRSLPLRLSSQPVGSIAKYEPSWMTLRAWTAFWQLRFVDEPLFTSHQPLFQDYDEQQQQQQPRYLAGRSCRSCQWRIESSSRNRESSRGASKRSARDRSSSSSSSIRTDPRMASDRRYNDPHRCTPFFSRGLCSGYTSSRTKVFVVFVFVPSQRPCSRDDSIDQSSSSRHLHRHGSHRHYLWSCFWSTVRASLVRIE